MDWYQQLQQYIRSRIDLRQTQLERLDETAMATLIASVLASPEAQALIPDAAVGAHHLSSNLSDTSLQQRVIDDLLGFGVLAALLRDPDVAEIMVNGPQQIYVERHGRLQLSPLQFQDESAVRQVVERMVAVVGRRIDTASPMVDTRLACGARVNIVIPPLAIHGSYITVRKFSQHMRSVQALCEQGSCSPQLAEFLELAVAAKQNLIVCGGTGTGKTTLLNILANWIAPTERVITIEDSAELRLAHAHLVSLEARPANQEGEGAVSIRQLVINALRMRPDRIVVGECRGGESLDMLQAMNTGHAGSMTTLHANTPRDGLRRLEVMVMMAGMELPLLAIRQQISSAIDIIVQLKRLPNGARIISQVTEVQGIEGDTMMLADIYNLSHGSHLASESEQDAQPTGDIPMFLHQQPEAIRQRALALLAIAV
ncbi:MAG: CpaF family protein [Firmicutes bacterium]|nr:CpaF family protein [Bacillota bacterium]